MKELVKELNRGREPSQSVNPDDVVAIGTVVQSGVINGNRNDVLLIVITHCPWVLIPRAV